MVASHGLWAPILLSIQLIFVHLLFHVVRPSTKAKYQMICVSYSYSFKFMNLDVVLLQPWVDSDCVSEPHIQLVSDSQTNFYLNSVRFGSLLLQLLPFTQQVLHLHGVESSANEHVRGVEWRVYRHSTVTGNIILQCKVFASYHISVIFSFSTPTS